jgi:hypothetical protein
MMRIKQKPLQKKSRALIYAILAILVLSLGYFGFAYATKSVWPFAQQSQIDKDGVNYSPPTEQEVEDSQNAKKDNSYQEEDTSKGVPSNQKKNVSVGIAFAGYDKDEKVIDVRAFTPNAIESDGTCTATFTQGTKTVSQSSKAFIDSSSSQCEPILIPENRFETKGTWKLVVTYVSSKSSGTSPSMNVEVSE